MEICNKLTQFGSNCARAAISTEYQNLYKTSPQEQLIFKTVTLTHGHNQLSYA